MFKVGLDHLDAAIVYLNENGGIDMDEGVFYLAD
jgi:hypothetical protein